MMKTSRRVLLRTLDALALLLGFAPPLALCGASVGLPWLALIPLLSIPVCVLLGLLPRKARLLPLAILSAFCGGTGWLLLPLEGVARVGYAALSAAIPLLALPLIGGLRMIGMQLILLGGHLAISLFVRVSPLTPFLTLCGCAQLVLFLLYLNLSQLRSQCGESRTARLTASNMRLTLALCVLIFALANAKALWNALSIAFQTVAHWVMELLNALLLPTSGDGAGEADITQLLGGGESEVSPIWNVMDVIVKVLTALLLLYAIYRLARILPQLLRRLLSRLRKLLLRYRDAVSSDYVDETRALDEADLRSLSALRQRRLRRRAAREPNWKKLDNREQVRVAYRLLRAQTKVSDALTAREQLTGPLGAPQLAAAYDRARYSAHAIAPAEAETARRALKTPRHGRYDFPMLQQSETKNDRRNEA